MLSFWFALFGIGLAASMVDFSSEETHSAEEADEGTDDLSPREDSETEENQDNGLLLESGDEDQVGNISNGRVAEGVRMVSGGDDDYIRTGTGNDHIFAGSGDDSVSSGDGDDRVFLSDGDDGWIDLAGRNDPEYGGDDFVRGGAGHDELISLGGADTLHGDVGHDTLRSEELLPQFNGGGAHADHIYGGHGNDHIFSDDGDTVVGGEGEDTITANFAPGIVSGMPENSPEDWAPIEVVDFNPLEDTLEVRLPSDETDAGGSLSYSGIDDEEITLTYGEFELITLRNVSFADLTEDNLVIR